MLSHLSPSMTSSFPQHRARHGGGDYRLWTVVIMVTVATRCNNNIQLSDDGGKTDDKLTAVLKRSSCSNYYSASALLAVQSAVLARPFLSVCLSVRPSRSSVHTNEDTIVWFSASGKSSF